MERVPFYHGGAHAGAASAHGASFRCGMGFEVLRGRTSVLEQGSFPETRLAFSRRVLPHPA